MSWTHDQKMAATSVDLLAYKQSLSPSDPDYAKASEHVVYRSALKSYGTDVIALGKNGPGSNPPGPPPPPPLP